MYLNIIVRTLRKILKLQIDIQRIKKPSQKTEYKNKQIVALCNKIIKISKDAYWAYNSIVALGQYITLGFALIASLSKIYSLILTVPGVNVKKPQLFQSISDGVIGKTDGDDDLGEEIPFEEDGDKESVLTIQESSSRDKSNDKMDNKQPPRMSINMKNMLISETILKQTLSFKNTYKLPMNQWENLQKLLQKCLKSVDTNENFQFDTNISIDGVAISKSVKVSKDQLFKTMEDKIKQLENFITDYMSNESQKVLKTANDVKKTMIGQLKKIPKKGKSEVNVNVKIVSEFMQWYNRRIKLISQDVKEIQDQLADYFDSLWNDNIECDTSISGNGKSLLPTGNKPNSKNGKIDLNTGSHKEDMIKTILEEVSKKRKSESIDDIFGVKKSKKEEKSSDNTTKKKKNKKKKGSAIDDIFS